MPLEHFKQQNNPVLHCVLQPYNKLYHQRGFWLYSLMTSILSLPSLLDSWRTMFLYERRYPTEYSNPEWTWTPHLSQDRRSSSVNSKITCMATVDHSPTSDIRAVFHLWATYVILNIAKGEGYTVKTADVFIIFLCGLWPTGKVRTLAFGNSREKRGESEESSERNI